ncbi:hypothetical protein F4821DRAFT_249519 [Hypoxylon rubiginosum]|uniref:Uncharacterized protein n=1 Tax=Hypoxylon rubiginosum TaxID=110542 RepID=A0ACC0CLR2_9PEZI|nr:hypothetical protein F4821DRAFT_249519 [Hypoxylon rubiginosum]
MLPRDIAQNMLNLLSVKLIELIACALDDRVELLALRCVCRHLYQATSVIFTRAWFTTLTIDFTPRCLHRLSNITKHDDLTLAVRCLRVADCYRPPMIRPLGLHEHDRRTRVLGEGLLWPQTAGGFLDLTSQQVNQFTVLLARFSLCTEICVTDDLDESPHPDDRADTKLFPIEACYIMLNLLARYRDLHIQNFTISFDRALKSDKTTRMPPGLTDLLVLSSWPTHLHHLNITWKIYDDSVSASVVMDLMIMAKCAQSMKLSLPNSPVSEDIFQFISQAPQLPALTELTLSDIHWLTPDILSAVIARFQGSLKSLHIDHVTLSDGDFNTFFGLLAGQNLPVLESITVADCFRVFFCPLRLNQDALKQCGGKSEFTLRHFRHKHRVNGMRYRGSGDGMRLALQTLADNSCYQLGAGPPSPGLVDTGDYVGDRVGHIVEKFT